MSPYRLISLAVAVALLVPPLPALALRQTNAGQKDTAASQLRQAMAVSPSGLEEGTPKARAYTRFAVPALVRPQVGAREATEFNILKHSVGEAWGEGYEALVRGDQQRAIRSFNGVVDECGQWLAESYVLDRVDNEARAVSTLMGPPRRPTSREISGFRRLAGEALSVARAMPRRAGLEEVIQHRQLGVPIRHGNQFDFQQVKVYRIGALAEWEVSAETLRAQRKQGRIVLYATTPEELQQLGALGYQQGTDYDDLVPVPVLNAEMVMDLVQNELGSAKATLAGIAVLDSFVPVEGETGLKFPRWSDPAQKLVVTGSVVVPPGEMAPEEYQRRAVRQVTGGPSESASRILAQISQPILDPSRPRGLRVAHVARIGDDEAGRALTQSLTEYGIDVSGMLVTPKTPSATTLALVRPGGQTVFNHVRGASDAFTASDLRASDYDGQLFGIHGAELAEQFMPGVLGVLRSAKEHSQIVTWDTVVDPLHHWSRFSPKEFDEILSLIDVFIPSIGEARAIMQGQSRLSDEAAQHLTPEQIAEYFIAHGSRAVFLKMGAEGSLIRATPESIFKEAVTLQMPVLQGLTIKDQTGMGDAFAGAVIKGVLMGWPPRKIALVATATGGLVGEVYGGTLRDDGAFKDRGLVDVLKAAERLKAQPDVQAALQASYAGLEEQGLILGPLKSDELASQLATAVREVAWRRPEPLSFGTPLVMRLRTPQGPGGATEWVGSLPDGATSANATPGSLEPTIKEGFKWLSVEPSGASWFVSVEPAPRGVLVVLTSLKANSLLPEEYASEDYAPVAGETVEQYLRILPWLLRGLRSRGVLLPWDVLEFRFIMPMDAQASAVNILTIKESDLPEALRTTLASVAGQPAQQVITQFPHSSPSVTQDISGKQGILTVSLSVAPHALPVSGGLEEGAWGGLAEQMATILANAKARARGGPLTVLVDRALLWWPDEEHQIVREGMQLDDEFRRITLVRRTLEAFLDGTPVMMYFVEGNQLAHLQGEDEGRVLRIARAATPLPDRAGAILLENGTPLEGKIQHIPDTALVPLALRGLLGLGERRTVPAVTYERLSLEIQHADLLPMIHTVLALTPALKPLEIQSSAWEPTKFTAAIRNPHHPVRDATLWIIVEWSRVQPTALPSRSGRLFTPAGGQPTEERPTALYTVEVHDANQSKQLTAEVVAKETGIVPGAFAAALKRMLTSESVRARLQAHAAGQSWTGAAAGLEESPVFAGLDRAAIQATVTSGHLKDRPLSVYIEPSLLDDPQDVSYLGDKLSTLFGLNRGQVVVSTSPYLQVRLREDGPPTLSIVRSSGESASRWTIRLRNLGDQQALPLSAFLPLVARGLQAVNQLLELDAAPFLALDPDLRRMHDTLRNFIYA